jgi:hypothetical protein
MEDVVKGGARIRSGPAADPNALVRERDGADWLKLPHGAVDLPAPDWPLEVPPSPVEAKAWARLWTLPQSLIWRHNRQEDQVARFVRTKVRADLPDASVPILTAARQAEEGLLLTVLSMRASKVSIDSAPTEFTPTVPAVDISRAKRDRLRMLGGGDVA